jgi:large subunit ribosomal protein L18
MRRARRTTAKIFGTATKPRLAVYRSNRSIAAQLIDDNAGRTLVSASAKGIHGKTDKTTKSMAALAVGEVIGKKAVEMGIKQAAFDRRSYKFHGRVKNVAEGAKKSGLTI